MEKEKGRFEAAKQTYCLQANFWEAIREYNLEWRWGKQWKAKDPYLLPLPLPQVIQKKKKRKGHQALVTNVFLCNTCFSPKNGQLASLRNTP